MRQILRVPRYIHTLGGRVRIRGRVVVDDDPARVQHAEQDLIVPDAVLLQLFHRDVSELFQPRRDEDDPDSAGRVQLVQVVDVLRQRGRGAPGGDEVLTAVLHERAVDVDEERFEAVAVGAPRGEGAPVLVVGGRDREERGAGGHFQPDDVRDGELDALGGRRHDLVLSRLRDSGQEVLGGFPRITADAEGIADHHFLDDACELAGLGVDGYVSFRRNVGDARFGFARYLKGSDAVDCWDRAFELVVAVFEEDGAGHFGRVEDAFDGLSLIDSFFCYDHDGDFDFLKTWDTVFKYLENCLHVSAAVSVYVLLQQPDDDMVDVGQVQSSQCIDDHETAAGLGEHPFGFHAGESRGTASGGNNECDWFALSASLTIQPDTVCVYAIRVGPILDDTVRVMQRRPFRNLRGRLSSDVPDSLNRKEVRRPVLGLQIRRHCQNLDDAFDRL